MFIVCLGLKKDIHDFHPQVLINPWMCWFPVSLQFIGAIHIYNFDI